MAIGYNQIICNARNLATTMNGIINALAEGVTIIGRPKILQLANNDDLLISWYEGTGGGGGGGGGGDEPSGDDDALKALKALIERSATSFTIPDGVTVIGTSAFYGCANLESVYVPGSVKTIGAAAFSTLPKLTSVELSEGLTTINSSAFYKCTALSSIDLPSTISSIESGAFSSATSLTSITVRAETPPSLNASAFSNVPEAANIYVPAASVDAYKAAMNWGTRAAHIQAIPS